MKTILSVLSACLLAGAAQAAEVVIAVADDGNHTRLGAGTGAIGSKNGLEEYSYYTADPLDDTGLLMGLGNTAEKKGMFWWDFADVVGTSLPSTIQAGTYTLSLRVGSDTSIFAGLNDLADATTSNTAPGLVAGFFSTFENTSVGTSVAAQNNAQSTKDHMHTEFNAISGVTYTAPTEAAPTNLSWATWTFTWVIAEGSPVIGFAPYFGIYTRVDAGPSTSAWYDDSILTYTPASGLNVPPVAYGQDITIFPGASTNIMLTGSDIEGSNLTYNVDSTGLVGALTGPAPDLSYAAANGYQGVDSFTFTVNDGELDSDPATVTIAVTNLVPTANAQSVVTFVDTDLNITLTGNDPDNGPDNMAYQVVTMPTNGSLSGSAPDLTYEPGAGYTGDDSFEFTVSDGLATSAVAIVSISVNEIPAVTGTISVNFHVGSDADAQDDHELTGAEVAGLDAAAFWNNINVGPAAGQATPGTIFPSTVLTNDAGASAAMIAPSTNSSWFVGYAASQAAVGGELGLTGNHDDLFNSYLALNGPDGDGDPADAAILEITGLGDAYTTGGYNLIIYSDSDRRNTSSNNRRSEFQVVSGGSTNTVFVEDDDPATPVNIFDGTYILSDLVEDGADYSNYTVVSNLTASSFTISIYSDDGGRGAISGFQIVPYSHPPAENFGLEVVSGDAVLSWEGGGTYNVLTNENLLSPNWGVAEPDASSPITINIGSESQLFYKLSE